MIFHHREHLCCWNCSFHLSYSWVLWGDWWLIAFYDRIHTTLPWLWGEIHLTIWFMCSLHLMLLYTYLSFCFSCYLFYYSFCYQFLMTVQHNSSQLPLRAAPSVNWEENWKWNSMVTKNSYRTQYLFAKPSSYPMNYQSSCICLCLPILHFNWSMHY